MLLHSSLHWRFPHGPQFYPLGPHKSSLELRAALEAPGWLCSSSWVIYKLFSISTQDRASRPFSPWAPSSQSRSLFEVKCSEQNPCPPLTVMSSPWLLTLMQVSSLWFSLDSQARRSLARLQGGAPRRPVPIITTAPAREEGGEAAQI